MKQKVLFVDDEPQITNALKRTLRKEPYEILSANSGANALAILSKQRVDVVVSDEKMPGMSGSDFLHIVCKEYPETIRIMLTGHATVETAIKAINDGEIYRFLIKPCNETELMITIRHALQHRALLLQSRRMLKTMRQQSQILEKLEQENPGLTRVARDEGGTIVMENIPADVDEFLAQLGCEVEKAEEKIYVKKGTIP